CSSLYEGRVAGSRAAGVDQSPSAGRRGGTTSTGASAAHGAARTSAASAKARERAVCKSSGVTRTEYSEPRGEDESVVIFALMTRRGGRKPAAGRSRTCAGGASRQRADGRWRKHAGLIRSSRGGRRHG